MAAAAVHQVGAKVQVLVRDASGHQSYQPGTVARNNPDGTYDIDIESLGASSPSPTLSSTGSLHHVQPWCFPACISACGEFLEQVECEFDGVPMTEAQLDAHLAGQSNVQTVPGGDIVPLQHAEQHVWGNGPGAPTGPLSAPPHHGGGAAWHPSQRLTPDPPMQAVRPSAIVSQGGAPPAHPAGEASPCPVCGTRRRSRRGSREAAAGGGGRVRRGSDPQDDKMLVTDGQQMETSIRAVIDGLVASLSAIAATLSVTTERTSEGDQFTMRTAGSVPPDTKSLIQQAWRRSHRVDGPRWQMVCGAGEDPAPAAH
eukprot:TRINITY_DN1238_c1_g1_i1.p1 TRINITY_DN1238_c1_g1~~TRINITY_DN1238_c1_g1_i1.p1  ORF type:complete len:343 (+),score=40.16 TRINITY_DN1238_c1_g1_i1:91-1029(+)